MDLVPRINHLTRGNLNLKLKRDFSKSSALLEWQSASPSPLVGAGGWCLLCGNAAHYVVVNSRYNDGWSVERHHMKMGIKQTILKGELCVCSKSL